MRILGRPVEEQLFVSCDFFPAPVHVEFSISFQLYIVYITAAKKSFETDKKVRRGVGNLFFLNDTLSGDATKICPEFPTFKRLGSPSCSPSPCLPSFIPASPHPSPIEIPLVGGGGRYLWAWPPGWVRRGWGWPQGWMGGRWWPEGLKAGSASVLVLKQVLTAEHLGHLTKTCDAFVKIWSVPTAQLWINVT